MASEEQEGDGAKKTLSVEVKGRDTVEDKAGGEVNLSSLRELEIGPKWIAPGYKTDRSLEREGADEKNRSMSPRNDWPRERGERRRKPERGKERDRRDRKADRGREIEKRNPLVDELEVSFSPDEKAFRALTSAIRANCRTYELFEIARLILEKPERFVVLIRSSKNRESDERKLYISVPDGLPFETEEEVTDYVLRNFLEKFFEIESIEVDPPSGEFPMVNRCSLTGEIIGPPNYHRYQELEQAHISDRLSHLSLEAARSKIESLKDPEKIENWLQKMTQQTCYKLRISDDGEASVPVFESLVRARQHVLIHQKQRVFKTSTAAKFGGRGIDRLPLGSNLRHCVIQALEEQKRFPLATANRLRGRLKRMKFDVYKRGSRGISYISAVRRRIRSSDDTFAEPVQELIEFIQKNPDIRASDLLKEFRKSSGATDGGEGAEVEYSGRPVGQITQDLHWLVAEGYVVEYSDGRLRPRGY